MYIAPGNGVVDDDGDENANKKTKPKQCLEH